MRVVRGRKGTYGKAGDFLENKWALREQMGDMIVCDGVCWGTRRGGYRVAPGGDLGELSSLGVRGAGVALCFWADKGFQELKCFSSKIVFIAQWHILG